MHPSCRRSFISSRCQTRAGTHRRTNQNGRCPSRDSPSTRNASTTAHCAYAQLFKVCDVTVRGSTSPLPLLRPALALRHSHKSSSTSSSLKSLENCRKPYHHQELGRISRQYRVLRKTGIFAQTGACTAWQGSRAALPLHCIAIHRIAAKCRASGSHGARSAVFGNSRRLDGMDTYLYLLLTQRSRLSTSDCKQN